MRKIDSITINDIQRGIEQLVAREVHILGQSWVRVPFPLYAMMISGTAIALYAMHRLGNKVL